MTIRVVVADTQAVVRTGIRGLLQSEADLAVIGEAIIGEAIIGEAIIGDEAIALARQYPDVVILDARLPMLSSVEAARRIRAAIPSAHLLALTAHTAHDDQSSVWGMLAAGVTGYILTTSEACDVIRAVRDVARGRQVLAPSVASVASVAMRVLARLAQHSVDATPLGDATPLSAREREVLRQAARGMTSKQIGRTLGISHRSVQNHLISIFTKLGVASRTEAVTVGLQLGLLDLRHDLAMD